MSQEELTRAVIALPTAERVRLIQDVVATLPAEGPAEPPALQPEQITAISARRWDEIERGEVETIPADEVEREMRERFLK